MCLAKAPGVFRCAVAGAPVTSWDGYDTHYTERYCGGTPATNPGAYSDSSVMAHVDKIEGALMLVHGAYTEGFTPNSNPSPLPIPAPPSRRAF